MAKKASRRAKGEGSIFKRKDGTWAGKVPVGFNSNGSIKYQYIYRKTQGEVKAKADELKGDVRNNSYADPNRITVAQWLDSWINVTIKESVKTTTWLSYESMIRKHIIPEIGGIRLMQLQTSNLQKLYNDKIKGGRADGKEGGLAPKSVRYIHGIISGALDQAIKEKLITQNVAKSVRLPKDPKKEMKTLELENVSLFLNTAKSNHYYKRYYAAYLLDTFPRYATYLRPSEP